MRSRQAGWITAVAAAIAVAGCPGPTTAAVCDDLCAMMMFDCGYAAFPDPTSCAQGCAYDASQGAEVHALYGCFADAGCDTPTVLQCAREYGP
ncbi:MAG: hypothetical protein ABMB14_37585 [Myxococcota bacterium]